MTKIQFLKTIFCLSLALGANTWGATRATASDSITQYHYDVLTERSHKKQIFTQGLVLYNDHFYESSGHYGQSFLAVYPVTEPENKWAQLSAKFARQTKLPAQYFAEGIALFDDLIYQLTWREQTLLIWDRETLELKRTLTYSGEGWGLTHDNTHFIRSDGSHRLTFHEPQRFAPVRVVEVYENGRPLVRLLLERGDTVTGLTRSPSKRGMLEQLGATAVVADAFDAVAVREAIAAAQRKKAAESIFIAGERPTATTFARRPPSLEAPARRAPIVTRMRVATACA